MSFGNSGGLSESRLFVRCFFAISLLKRACLETDEEADEDVSG
jgi:hypothetical protein